jgi:hypothetical protein
MVLEYSFINIIFRRLFAMKKLLVLAMSAMILACGSVSASALESPSVDTHPSEGENNKPNNGGSSNSGTSTGNPSTGNPSAGKSPVTGVSATYAVYAALAALTCGGVAVIAKKKISE